jgi:hypothetical protein
MVAMTKHAQPGREYEIVEEHGGGIGAQTEKGGMAQGKLAAVTADDIPGFARRGEKKY